MKQHLAISAIGPDRTGLVHDLCKVISDCGGSIGESRMTALGGDFGVVMQVSGNWHSLAKIETELARFAEESGVTLNLRRTEPRGARAELPYTIDVLCLEQTGVVAALAGFCAKRGIDISSVTTGHYTAAQTGAQMLSVQMDINIPERVHLGQLREEFLDFCDARNLDAILEAVK